MLSRFLTDTFPGLNDTAASNECWIVKAIRSERPGLNVFSEALEVVCRYGEVKSLQTKLKREHPLDREHNCQHDARIRDCLTEACAFAWVVWHGLGTPAFCDKEGTPDIFLADGRSIEANPLPGDIEGRPLPVGRRLAGHELWLWPPPLFETAWQPRQLSRPINVTGIDQRHHVPVGSYQGGQGEPVGP